MISLLKESKYDRLLEQFIHTNTSYSSINQIGEGSHGIAYLLEHKETGEKAVLKTLLPEEIYICFLYDDVLP